MTTWPDTARRAAGTSSTSSAIGSMSPALYFYHQGTEIIDNVPCDAVDIVDAAGDAITVFLRKSDGPADPAAVPPPGQEDSRSLRGKVLVRSVQTGGRLPAAVDHPSRARWGPRLRTVRRQLRGEPAAERKRILPAERPADASPESLTGKSSAIPPLSD